jgi:hypothetical protein
MALLNSHPDYLNDPNSFRVYAEFLETMKKNEEYWHALPCDVASWWKSRAESAEIESSSPALSTVRLEGEMIAV